MSSSAPRTLADQLRSWPEERLAQLLAARPDLTQPAPRDSAQLAARAVVRTSVLRALEELDRLDLTVLEAVAQVPALGPTSATEIEAQVHADPASVRGALERLRLRALVWGTDEHPRPTAVVAELLALPAGPAGADVPALLEEVDDEARRVLDHLAATGVDGVSENARRAVTREQARTPTERLLARRLLVPRDERHLTVPWSVRLALHGGRSTPDPVDRLPELALSERGATLVDRGAAGAAFEVVRRVELLLDHWGSHPPGALRAGGLGVREVKAAATFLHVDPATVTLLVEVAAAAGLLAVGSTDDLDAAWLPTDAFDAWLARPAAARWVELVRAWLALARVLPTDEQTVDARTGRPANALAPGLEQGWVSGLRRSVLTELLDTPPGSTLAPGTGVASLVERLRWRRPRRPQGQLRQVEPVLQQAAVLGVLGLDGLSAFGRALLEGADPAAVLAPLLPAPVDHLLLQADLTAVAPGPLEDDLARKVALLAETESRGGATVYRFTATSLRRGLDAGWSAAEVHAFLEQVSRTPVPQALSYLVDDVVRRFGTVRAGQAESFLRSDDETALAELVHHPQAGSLRLRRIAPTVLVSDVPLGTLLPRLRELGVAPVVEAPDGTVQVARPDVFRARTPRVELSGAMPSGREQARASARVAAVVTAVRSGDRAAAARPRRGPATKPADVVSLLREAIEAGSPVLIGYLDNHGTATERRVRPQRVEGGRLTAYDERSDDVRDFAIHRITTAAPTSVGG